MALSIKDRDVERLVDEVARLAGESKTEAMRRSLEERRARLALCVADSGRVGRMRHFLETEVWPTIPADQRGKRLTREEEDEILGYGPTGA